MLTITTRRPTGRRFLCYDADNPTDRFSATSTVKVQDNIYIEEESVLRADSGKPLRRWLRYRRQT